MQFKLLTLLTAMLFSFVTINAQAVKDLKKAQEVKAQHMKEMQTKSEAARAESAERQKSMQMAKADAMGKGGMTPNVVSDLKLSAEEEKFNINGYKVDFASNPYSLTENAVVTISLYSGLAQNQVKVGVINFYTKGAKMLADRKAVDDKKFVTLNYDLESFELVKDFLATGNRLALVANNKTKEAYITTDVMATRTK